MLGSYFQPAGEPAGPDINNDGWIEPRRHDTILFEGLTKDDIELVWNYTEDTYNENMPDGTVWDTSIRVGEAAVRIKSTGDTLYLGELSYWKSDWMPDYDVYFYHFVSYDWTRMAARSAYNQANGTGRYFDPNQIYLDNDSDNNTGSFDLKMFSFDGVNKLDLFDLFDLNSVASQSLPNDVKAAEGLLQELGTAAGSGLVGGTAGADTLVGSAGDDEILAGAGNDSLDGGGGNDFLRGGDGADLISGGVGNDNLDGSSGSDRLDGGSGVDRLAGGLGDDIYVVDDAADVIVERVGEGEDWVFSSVDYTMTSGAYIEVLSTTYADGTAPINLTANDLGNSVYGNAGNNVLNGGGGNDQLVGGSGNDTLNGGAGVDHMAGGGGNDIYIIDNAADTVTELTGEGEDWVFSGVSFTMTANAYIEVLSTTWADGAAAINLTANDIGNSVYGNAGANVLSGAGGNDQLVSNGGADTLIGGAGNDSFVLSNKAVTNPGAGNIATITDYASGDIVDLPQILSVASGIDVIGGLYLKLTAGGQIQVDLDGGGNAWTTVANINGSGAVDMRYLSAGSASQLSVSRSANAPELNPKTTTAAVQPELEPDRRLALMVQDMANFGASAFHGQRIEPHWDRPADIFAAIS